MADPREAVAVASRLGCDVVVADLDLPRPGWSGPYVLRRIRELCPRVRSFLIADTDAWAPLVRGAADGLIAREPQDEQQAGGSLAQRLIEALQTCEIDGAARADTWRTPAPASGAAGLAPRGGGEAPTEEAPRFAATHLRGSGVGDVIAGKYRLEGELGHGGMGIVYRAVDTFIGRQVAVKLLKFPAFLGGGPVRDRMRREVMITGRLAHPNLVTVFDAGTDQGEIYIVLELIEGQSLKEVLLERHHLPPAEAVGITLQILDALEHSHGQGIVHRDLKPGNVLVTRDGRAKVVDFGIAKLLSLATGVASMPLTSAANTSSGGDPRHTRIHGAGTAAGRRNRRPDRPLFARRPAFRDAARLLAQLDFSPFARGPRGPLPLLAHDRRLTALVEKALAPALAERFASAAEMKAALAELARPAPRRPGGSSEAGNERPAGGRAVRRGPGGNEGKLTCCATHFSIARRSAGQSIFSAGASSCARSPR